MEEKELICLARRFQHEKFDYLTAENSKYPPQCLLCEYKSECYIVKYGELERYAYIFNGILGKLQKETGIYLGFDFEKSNPE